jgi:hypothetical protein
VFKEHDFEEAKNKLNPDIKSKFILQDVLDKFHNQTFTPRMHLQQYIFQLKQQHGNKDQQSENEKKRKATTSVQVSTKNNTTMLMSDSMRIPKKSKSSTAEDSSVVEESTTSDHEGDIDANKGENVPKNTFQCEFKPSNKATTSIETSGSDDEYKNARNRLTNTSYDWHIEKSLTMMFTKLTVSNALLVPSTEESSDDYDVTQRNTFKRMFNALKFIIDTESEKYEAFSQDEIEGIHAGKRGKTKSAYEWNKKNAFRSLLTNMACLKSAYGPGKGNGMYDMEKFLTLEVEDTESSVHACTTDSGDVDVDKQEEEKKKELRYYVPFTSDFCDSDEDIDDNDGKDGENENNDNNGDPGYVPQI